MKLESEIPSENGQRKFRGFIEALENEVITLKTDQGEANIPFNTLVKAKLVLTDDLIKRTANK